VRAKLLAALWVLSVVGRTESAQAHERAPGVLGVEQQADGRYLVAWTPPVDTRLASAARVSPRFPSHCRHEGAVLDCGARGLDGEIALDGLAGRMRVAVVITRLDAPPLESILDADVRTVPVERGGSPFVRWIAMGIEHVLLGLDHLAFLVALLLVSRLDRRLVVTVTAFTIAHSITLGLAVLDLVRPSSALVEALIALSVLLVAREGLVAPGVSGLERVGAEVTSAEVSSAGSSVRRAPWAVAAFFGLVHGLGLAGALRDLSLPSAGLGPALFGFNVGVELGQLAFVGVALVIARAASMRSWAPRARTVLAYGVGIAASYWLAIRVAGIVA